MEKNKLFETIKIGNVEIYTEQLKEVKPLSCAVNSATGRERYYEIKPANNSKNLMVIGGGLAGMEASRIAKTLGYNVTLYEKGKELGGYVIPGSEPDLNFDDRRLLNWYENEMKILEVNLVMNTEVTELMINDKMPDVVIVATGASEIFLKEIPGIDKEKVATACEVLEGSKTVGQNIIMVGGGLVGCETALWLAQQGKKVTIVENYSDILSSGKSIPYMNKIMLIDLLNINKVEKIINTSLLEVTDDGVVISNDKFGENEIKADTVVLAVGFKSEQDLCYKMNGKIADLYIIGDANNATNIMNAI